MYASCASCAARCADAPWRSAASAEMGVCGAAWAWAAGAGAAADPPSDAVSVPQAAAPNMTAVIVRAAARFAFLRRRLVVAFMVVPLVGSCLGWCVVAAAAATAHTDTRRGSWIRKRPAQHLGC